VWFAHLRETSSGTAPGQFAHALLHALDGLRCHAPANDPSLAYPEGEAEELGARYLNAGVLANGVVIERGTTRCISAATTPTTLKWSRRAAWMCLAQASRSRRSYRMMEGTRPPN
jgi:hypothetical protein